MNRTMIATEVARDLTSAEEAVDAALAQSVRLLRRMMDARRELGLPVGAGEPALKSVIAAVSSLGEAQRDMTRSHGDLQALQRDLGLPSVAFGPLIKPGEDVETIKRAG